MDSRTGEIYPSAEAAVAAGVPAEAIVTGPEPALRHLARMVKRDLNSRRRRRRRLQKDSRRRNRRG